MMEADKSFSWNTFRRKVWVIALAGLVLPPVGIILAWLKPDWSRRTKWLATALMAVLLFARYRTSTAEKSQEHGVASQVSDSPSAASSNAAGGWNSFEQGERLKRQMYEKGKREWDRLTKEEENSKQNQMIEKGRREWDRLTKEQENRR